MAGNVEVRNDEQVLEEAWGQKRLDPNPVEISVILARTQSKRTFGQIKNEFFRILEGMTSGDAQVAIVQGMARDVLDVFRRLIPKGKSRTKAAVREWRQNINLPRRAKSVGDYDVAVAEWDANLAKLISYRGQDSFLAQEDSLEAYCSILPSEVMTFAQLKGMSPLNPTDSERGWKNTYTERYMKPRPIHLLWPAF